MTDNISCYVHAYMTYEHEGMQAVASFLYTLVVFLLLKEEDMKTTRL